MIALNQVITLLIQTALRTGRPVMTNSSLSWQGKGDLLLLGVWLQLWFASSILSLFAAYVSILPKAGAKTSTPAWCKKIDCRMAITWINLLYKVIMNLSTKLGRLSSLVLRIRRSYHIDDLMKKGYAERKQALYYPALNLYISKVIQSPFNERLAIYVLLELDKIATGSS